MRILTAEIQFFTNFSDLIIILPQTDCSLTPVSHTYSKQHFIAKICGHLLSSDRVQGSETASSLHTVAIILAMHGLQLNVK